MSVLISSPPLSSQGGSAPLALPHLSVPDVAFLDWAALKAAGFTGVVFDKDNTLTAPYSAELTPAGAAAVAGAAAAWGPAGVALLSNSAGLAQYDPDGDEADALEAALGVPVIRHSSKKPGGSGDALAAHFGIPAAAVPTLVMVGDRYLTDVVYGNRLGLLTVRPAPITAAGEPRAVRLVRKRGEREREGEGGPYSTLSPCLALSRPSFTRAFYLFFFPGSPRGGRPGAAVDGRGADGPAARAGADGGRARAVCEDMKSGKGGMWGGG